jgi:predicted small lipoprotein YifL
MKTATTMLAITLVAAMLTSCGRAGSPLKPSEAARDRAKAENLPPPEKPVSNRDNTEKRFILDGLLE